MLSFIKNYSKVQNKRGGPNKRGRGGKFFENLINGGPNKVRGVGEKLKINKWGERLFGTLE